MPTAPQRYRPIPARQQERSWASRQTDYRGWYQLPIWKGEGGIREQVILRDLCQCRECKRQGRTTMVLLHVKRGQEKWQAQVDHIRPHGGDENLFFDIDNCETKCASCHSAKTQREQR